MTGEIVSKKQCTRRFYFTGQVNIESRISAQISQPVDGQISGISESPIFGVISQLFSTIFGRRLGTVDDGTSQKQMFNKVWIQILMIAQANTLHQIQEM